MKSLKKILEYIRDNAILKNVILAVCSIIVFMFLVSILLNLFTRHNNSNEVPNLSGITVAEAKKLAKKGSLRVEVNDSIYVPIYEGGIILDQLPKPGTRVKSGRRVFVTVNSFKQKMVKIPYVTGYSLRQAKNNLEVAGLEIDRLVFRTDMASNNVLEQQYNGKVIGPGNTIEAEQGSGVTLVVGKRDEDSSPVVPKVVGFPLKEAKSRLWESGLNVGKVELDEDINLLNRTDAKVYTQSPEQGTRAAAGTQINIKLTLDPEKIDKGSTESDRAAKRIIPAEQARQRAEEEARAAEKTEQGDDNDETDFF